MLADKPDNQRRPISQAAKAALTVSVRNEFSLIRAQMAWTEAKENQVLADGTSGEITPARLAILEEIGPHESQPPAEPTPPEEQAAKAGRNGLCRLFGSLARQQ